MTGSLGSDDKYVSYGIEWLPQVYGTGQTPDAIAVGQARSGLDMGRRLWPWQGFAFIRHIGTRSDSFGALGQL